MNDTNYFIVTDFVSLCCLSLTILGARYATSNERVLRLGQHHDIFRQVLWLVWKLDLGNYRVYSMARPPSDLPLHSAFGSIVGKLFESSSPRLLLVLSLPLSSSFSSFLRPDITTLVAISLSKTRLTDHCVKCTLSTWAVRISFCYLVSPVVVVVIPRGSRWSRQSLSYSFVRRLGDRLVLGVNLCSFASTQSRMSSQTLMFLASSTWTS